MVNGLERLGDGGQLQYGGLPSDAIKLHFQKGLFNIALAFYIGLDAQLWLLFCLGVEVEVQLTGKIIWKAD